MTFFAVGREGATKEKSKYAKTRDFHLQDISGNTIRLSDYKGKVILLNFFATWCLPCRVEMPDFKKVSKEYKNEEKLLQN